MYIHYDKLLDFVKKHIHLFRKNTYYKEHMQNISQTKKQTTFNKNE